MDEKKGEEEKKRESAKVAAGKRKMDDQGPSNDKPVKRMCARMSTGGSHGAMHCGFCGLSFSRFRLYEDHLQECRDSYSFDPSGEDEDESDESEEDNDEEEEEESEKEAEEKDKKILE